MTIYVDDLIAYPQRANSAQGWRHFGAGKRSCHLFTDGNEQELIAFAKRIGLKPQWIQRTSITHFDLTPLRRAAAVQAGAREVTMSEMIEIMRARRAADEQATP